MTTVKNLQFWLVSFLEGNGYNFKAVDNPKDLTPIVKYSDLHSDLWKWKCYPWFFQTVSCILLVGFLSFWQKIIYRQMSRKVNATHILLFFLGIGNIVHLGVLLLRMRVYTHVGFTSESQAIPCLSTWLSASPSRDKNLFWNRAMCVSPIFTSGHLWDFRGL